MFDAGFGEASPEKKAAKNMHNFFTYIAVRIVGAQLEVPSIPSCYIIPFLKLNCDSSSVSMYATQSLSTTKISHHIIAVD